MLLRLLTLREPEYTEGQGFSSMTVTADVYVFGSITEQIYEVEFRQRPDSKGRPVLSMSHAELMRQFLYYDNTL